MPAGPCRSLLLAAALLAAAVAGGCAHPLAVGRGFVSCELTDRMGLGLGPDLPPAELALPFEPGQELTEDDAAALALWNHPGYQELLADLSIARADVIQAGQLTNPQLSTLFPTGPKLWELWILTPVDVLALRPHRVCAAQLEAHRVAQRLVQDGLNVVRDARTAVVDLRLAGTLAELARENHERIAELARIGEARLKGGAISELDLAPLRLELIGAKDRLARADLDREIARQRLAFLIGASQSGDELTLAPEEPAAEKAIELPDAAELVADAVASRPDIRAAELAVQAACERHRLAYWDYFDVNLIYPDLNSGGDVHDVGPGLRLNIPLFHRNQGMKARTAAEVERAMRQRTRLADTAALEVRQAATRLAQARRSQAIWRDDALPRADEANTAAGKALAEDGTSLLTVLETTRQWVTARQRGAETAAEVARARIELERSLGHRWLPAETIKAAPVPEELP